MMIEYVRLRMINGKHVTLKVSKMDIISINGYEVNREGDLIERNGSLQFHVVVHAAIVKADELVMDKHYGDLRAKKESNKP